MTTLDFARASNHSLAEAHGVSMAMPCVERLPQHCHRAFIADYLSMQAVSVLPHRFQPAAWLFEEQLRYDGGVPSQLTLEW